MTPHTRCRLKLLKQERIKDFLLLEEEFIQNQQRLKPTEEKDQEEHMKLEDLRGTPMSVGNLEEIVDENHAIVSSTSGTEYYVAIMSFVDKDALTPGTTILLHHKVCLSVPVSVPVSVCVGVGGWVGVCVCACTLLCLYLHSCLTLSSPFTLSPFTWSRLLGFAAAAATVAVFAFTVDTCCDWHSGR